ncbi:MAG: Wzz/FepE/Etk N-terminal domain-containing protein, partial [Gammaproteobacteria bacterium]
MEQSAKNLKDYLDMGRRHKRALFLIPTIVFAIGLLLARFLPDTYSSTATILIEQQQIPMELVRSTVTSFAEQRIQSISQRVMTRRNLLRIMTNTGAYEERRKRETTEAVITRMRENISLHMIRGPVASGRGGVMSGTIAFNISFEGSSPKITQRVTQELTTLYLNENLQARNKTAQETLRFLTSEGERLKKQLGKLSGQLVEFKGKHRNTLPELHSFNLQTLTSSNERLLSIEDNIRLFEEQIGLTETALALTNPYGMPMGSQFSTGTQASMETSPLDPATRLKDLRSRQKIMRTNYSANHPDMVRLQRSIKSL